MLRKSLIIGFVALVGAAFIFTGCEKEVVKEVTGPESILFINTWVDDEIELTTALADEKSGVIGIKAPVDLSKLTETLQIPANKTIVIFSGVSGKAITVEGTVYIGADGSLEATSANKISVKGAGTIVVEKDGNLITDFVTSIDDGAATPLPVLGSSKVTFTSVESKLSISSANTTIEILKLGFGSFEGKGTLAITTPVSLLPSELAKIEGISADKRLVVTTSGVETATDAELTIPAGLDITLTAGLGTVKDFIVEGSATITTADAAPTGSVTVSGTLNIKGKALTIAANQTLTVNGTLGFDATGSLKLPATASLALTATSKLLDVIKVTLSVEGATPGTATKAKVETADAVHTITTEATTGTAVTTVIGNASFAFTDALISKLKATDAAATAAAGTLKSGAATTLILAGSI